jgi:hypothetical protein
MRTLIAALALVLSTSLSATHLLTGNFSFEHQSTGATTSTYKVTLHLYRDLNGINLPSSTTVYYKKLSQTSPTSLALTQNSSNSFNFTSNCGSNLGVGVVSYEGTVTVDNNSGYEFYYTTCCRPPSVSNLSNPSSQSYYMTGTLVTGKPAIRTYNNSPTFQASIATAYANSNFPYEICQADPDGDSLSFQIIPSKSAASTNIAFATGYSLASPLGNSSEVSIDTANRMLVVNSPVQQNSLVNVKIVEWAKDTTGTYKIMGMLEREILFNIVAAPATAPSNVSATGAMGLYGTQDILVSTAAPVFPTSANFDSVQVQLFDGTGSSANKVVGSSPMSSSYQAFAFHTNDSLQPGPYTLVFAMNPSDSASIVGSCGKRLIDTISFFVAPPPPVLVGPSDSIYGANATYNVLNYQYLDSASFSITNGTVVTWQPDYSQFDIAWGPVNGPGEFTLIGFANGGSDTATVTVQINGIGIVECYGDILLFPNPAREYVNVLGMPSTATYSITDLSGRKVANGTLEHGKVDVSTLPNGTYVLLLEGPQTLIKKIQIQH